MSWHTFQANLASFEQAIQTCFQKRLHLPALVLAYSLIDHLAWINMPDAQQDVTRDDFGDWVEKYVLSGSGLRCTALDLYAARCALLHTHAAESRLTRHSAAKQVFYAWGKADVQVLEQLAVVKSGKACAVRIEALLGAISDGKQRFLADIEKDADLKPRAVRRSAKIFGEVRAGEGQVGD